MQYERFDFHEKEDLPKLIKELNTIRAYGGDYLLYPFLAAFWRMNCSRKSKNQRMELLRMRRSWSLTPL